MKLNILKNKPSSDLGIKRVVATYNQNKCSKMYYVLTYYI